MPSSFSLPPAGSCNVEEPRLRILAWGEHLPQSSWLESALRSLGHEVVHSAVGGRIDLLLVHDPSTIEPGQVASFRRLGVTTILRAWRDPDCFVNYRHLARQYDWVLTNGMAEMVHLWDSEGVRALPLLPGAPPWIEEYEASPVQRDIDIVFAGRLDEPERRERLEFLRRAGKMWKIAVASDSQAWPGPCPLDAGTLRALHRRAKLSLHMDRISVNRFGVTRGAPGTRPFAGPVAGCVLLTQLLPWLNQCYDVANELLGFSNVEHALELAAKYLEEPEQLEILSAAGQARCRAEHSEMRRAQELASLASGVVPLNMQILALGPWYQRIELPGGQTTNHMMMSNVERWERLRIHLPPLRACRVLDLGMNAGFFALQCVKLGAARVVGVDKSPLACAQARFIFAKWGITNIDIVHGDLTSAPAEPFDICLLLAVLHHLPDIRPILELAVRRAPNVLVEWELREHPHCHSVDHVFEAFAALGCEAQLLSGGRRPILRAHKRQFSEAARNSTANL